MATFVGRKRQLPNGMKAELVTPGPLASAAILGRLERFTVKQFLKMVDDRIFPCDKRVELLDGLVFHKMTQHPPHSAACQLALRFLLRLIPEGWHVRDQKPIAIPGSLPEPDLAVVRGNERRYGRQHPHPQDVGLLIEVADTTLSEDRDYKGPLYARARLPVYWILNLSESIVEVYMRPRAGKDPYYRQRQDYTIDDFVPVVIDGQEIGRLAVRDLLP